MLGALEAISWSRVKDYLRCVPEVWTRTSAARDRMTEYLCQCISRVETIGTNLEAPDDVLPLHLYGPSLCSRYRHRGFVNVGVVLVSAEGRFADFGFGTGPALSRMFSDFDRGHFRTVIRHLESRLAMVAKQVRGLPFKENPRDALAKATRVLREDDSAFQWSPPGGGISSDLRQTLAHTYERLVVRHENAPSRDSRSGRRRLESLLEVAARDWTAHEPAPKKIATGDEKSSSSTPGRTGSGTALSHSPSISKSPEGFSGRHTVGSAV